MEYERTNRSTKRPDHVADVSQEPKRALSLVRGGGGGGGGDRVEESDETEGETKNISKRLPKRRNRTFSYRFRETVLEDDLEPLRLLYERAFPISYGKRFYQSLLREDGPIRTVIVVEDRKEEPSSSFDVETTCIASTATPTKRTDHCESLRDDRPPPALKDPWRAEDFDTADGRLLGSLSARFVTGKECKDEGITTGQTSREGLRLLYLMTLAVRPEYRRKGVASRLVRRCLEIALRDPNCAATYLHVISYNTAAMTFYERLGFKRLRRLSAFYKINEKSYDCYVYVHETRPYEGGGKGEKAGGASYCTIL